MANADRRRILDLLREAEQCGQPGVPTGEIVLALGELSRYAVMQHLRVLERANLIVTHKHGRLVLNHLNAVPIRQIYERWVSEFEGSWAASLTGLKRRVEGAADGGEQSDVVDPFARAFRHAGAGTKMKR